MGGLTLTPQTLRRLAEQGRVAEVRSLLRARVDPNQRGADGSTALHAALKVVEHLPEKDHITLLELLHSAGADLEQGGPEGATALHVAARTGLAEAVEWLLQAGADPDRTMAGDFTALHLVIERAEEHPREFSLQVTRRGKVVKITDPDEIRAMLGSHPEDGYQACVYIAELLIGAGANVNAPKSPSEQTPVSDAASRGTPEILDLLIQTGQADVRVRDHWGLTPLHYAARSGHSSTLVRLLAAGAHVDAADQYGFTALHEATENGHLNVVRHLVTAGADIRHRLHRRFPPYPHGADALAIAQRAGQQHVERWLRARLRAANG